MGTYQTIDICVKVGGFALTGFGALRAAQAYRQNVSLAKAKWLEKLHSNFFNHDSQYREIRQLLDYHYSDAPTPAYNQLKKIMEAGTNDEIETQEKFIAYLNFFEFIATLHKTNQLKTEETRLVFGYYLKTLGDHSWVITYINDSKNGFKNLGSLIAEIKTLEGRK